MTTVVEEMVVPITRDVDVVTARQEGRRLASELGFSVTDLTLIATAISELTRNILSYAQRGHVTLKLITRDGRSGVEVIAQDDGPGIADVERALEDGFSTQGSLGLGLPGVRRLMDDFEIVSHLNEGTTVTARKWAQSPR